MNKDMQFAQFMKTVIMRANKEVSKKNRTGLAAFYDATPSDLDIIYATLDIGWNDFKQTTEKLKSKAVEVSSYNMSTLLLGVFSPMLSIVLSYWGNMNEALKSLLNNLPLINDIINVGDTLLEKFLPDTSEDNKEKLLTSGSQQLIEKSLSNRIPLASGVSSR